MPLRIAGIDYGTVRIGVAIGTLEHRLASPLCIYQRRSPTADAAFFRELTAKEAIGRYVVGLPVHLDGRESQKSTEARAFAAWLAETTGVPVDVFDERFTTVEAEALLGEAGFTKKRRRARLDKVAAQILLTAYLERGGRGDDSPQGLN